MDNISIRSPHSKVHVPVTYLPFLVTQCGCSQNCRRTYDKPTHPITHSVCSRGSTRTYDTPPCPHDPLWVFHFGCSFGSTCTNNTRIRPYDPFFLCSQGSTRTYGTSSRPHNPLWVLSWYTSTSSWLHRSGEWASLEPGYCDDTNLLYGWFSRISYCLSNKYHISEYRYIYIYIYIYITNVFSSFDSYVEWEMLKFFGDFSPV